MYEIRTQESRKESRPAMKMTRARLLALPMALMAAMTMTTASMAAIQVDKPIHYAGETVLISGGGLMTPGETVSVLVGGPDGSVAQLHQVIADSAGNFSDT